MFPLHGAPTFFIILYSLVGFVLNIFVITTTKRVTNNFQMERTQGYNMCVDSTFFISFHCLCMCFCSFLFTGCCCVSQK